MRGICPLSGFVTDIVTCALVQFFLEQSEKSSRQRATFLLTPGRADLPASRAIRDAMDSDSFYPGPQPTLSV
jgi:hypothetical protein